MGLHLRHGQQAWGHGLGRSCRDLPPAVSAALAASVSDLEDRLHILDALYIPRRVTPIACPMGPRPTISAGSRASLLRWPEPEQILNQVRQWAAQAAAEHPGLERVALSPSGAAPQLRCPGTHAHRTRRTADQRHSHGRSAATGQPLVVAQVVISRFWPRPLHRCLD